MINWKAIPGYEGRYDISSQGDILSLVITRRILRRNPRPDGYQVTLSNRTGIRRQWLVQRLLLLTFCPIDQPELFDALCIDHDKHNLSLENWRWIPRETKYRNRLRLTDKQSEAIARRLFDNPMLTYETLAQEYGVSKNAIARAFYRAVWTSEG